MAPKKLVGQKYVLRAATWTVVHSWFEQTWNQKTGKYTKTKWVRLRRDQNHLEESRPFYGKPKLEKKT